eukprot:1159089-Pelagomonas_calceolata.AAC.12
MVKALSRPCESGGDDGDTLSSSEQGSLQDVQEVTGFIGFSARRARGGRFEKALCKLRKEQRQSGQALCEMRRWTQKCAASAEPLYAWCTKDRGMGLEKIPGPGHKVQVVTNSDWPCKVCKGVTQIRQREMQITADCSPTRGTQPFGKPHPPHQRTALPC